jgi:integrase
MYRLLHKQDTGLTKRRLVMARRSFQRGCLQWHNDQWTLLYWLKDHKTGRRVQKRESAAFKSFVDRNDKKAALQAAIGFLRTINELNSNPKTATRKEQTETGLTFGEFIKTRWASYVAKRKMEPSTLAGYDSIISKHLLPVFGERQIASITAGDMTDFFDGLRGRMKAKTAANIFGLLNVMFDVAMEYELIESKPLRKKLHKPEFEKEEKPVLSPEVVRDILMGLPYAHRLFIVMLSVLTIRIGEGLALRWLNLDFDSCMLQLTHSLWRGKLKPTLKTKSSKRRFVLPDALVKALESYRQQSQFNRAEDFIFPNSFGGPLEPGNFRKRVLYPVMDELGIKREERKHRFHLFRHSAATILHEETGDIEVAQRALGHARRSTTEDIYDHVEQVIGEKVTGLLLDAIAPDLSILSSDAIN